MEDLPEAELYELTLAWVRRKRWEARLQATELARVLTASVGAPTPSPTPTRIPAHQMLREMGVTIEGMA